MFKLLIQLIKIGIPVGMILFGLIQFIPYGRSHSDPPLSDPVTWNSPETQQLAMQA